MKFSKKQLTLLLGCIVVLAVGNVALAALWLSRDVDITGGVDTVGTIEVYDEDALTLLTSYDFPNFTGGVGETSYKEFFIVNTGNQPVYVHWNISSSSLTWNPTSIGYQEASISKYVFSIQNASSLDYLAPNDYSTPTVANALLYIDVGESAYMRIEHEYMGYPSTAEQYSLTMTFYAEDAQAIVDQDGDGVPDIFDADPNNDSVW